MQLCADAACTTVLEALTTTSTAAQPTAPLPRASAVFWRVTAINDSFTSSSLTWVFFVGQLTSPLDTSWLGAPDFNRDGLPDVGLGSAANQAYTMINSTLGLPTTTPSQTISGGANFARSTANAGDTNGDGFGDFLVGGFGAGAFVYYGDVNGVTTSGPAILSGADTEFGYSVAGVGDVNADGYADVVIGDADTTGKAHLYLGSAAGVASAATDPVLLGSPAAAAGDINGDGYADVVLCNRFSGNITTYHGSASGLTAGATIAAPAGQSGFGETCSTAGDVNGDGYADVMAAASGTSAVYLYYGSVNGAMATGATVVTGASGGGFNVTTSIAPAGDVNGDGYADIVVGGYNGNVVYVYHGSATGLVTTAATSFSFTAGGYANSVATAGDANGDRYADIVFAPSQCSGYDVFAYPGSAAGIDKTTPLRSWPVPSGSQCFGIIAR